jgi:general secretion pathway protein D
MKHFARLSPSLLVLALAFPTFGEDVTPPVVSTPTVQSSFAMEFRGARLGQVLDFLSQQAGYVIANPIELPQPITVIAKQPVTPSEAVEALNAVLIDNGYIAIVRGRNLHVVALSAAKLQNLPVAVGSDPEKMSNGDGMVTQVMPVQFATAKDLVENLQPLLNSSTATMSANEAANVIILTDTQDHVRRIASIIQGIDRSVSGDMDVRVFHLANADADKVASIINTIYGKATSQNGNNGQQMPNFAQMFGRGNRGNQGPAQGADTAAGSTARGVDVSAAADSGTNSVVVRGTPSVLGSLSEVIKQLDVDTTAREDVLVYRVRNGKAEDIATSLSTLFSSSGSGTTTTTTQRGNQQGRQGGGQQGAQDTSSTSLDLSGKVQVVADTTSNSVLVLSLERNFSRLEKMLTDLDQPMRQVLVRVLMAEVTYENNLDLGVELSGVNPANATTSSRTFTDFGTFDSTLGSTLGLNGFLLNRDDFHAAVRALSTNTTFDVLSRPYILTADNQEAVVNVSENVPIPNGTRTDQNNNVTTTFDRQDVGIILTVTPQINADGRVLLDVDQVLSALTDQSVAVSAGISSPIIKKRTMTTRVSVDSGQTVVIGGLVHDSTVKVVSKVPILGDIPLLGIFFRRTKDQVRKTELLLFLTPQVIGSSSEMEEMSRQLRGEMERMDAAVEKGRLQHHLDQLANLKVGEPIPVRAAPAAAAEGGKP